MSKITVIDAPMGKGKTSWAINYINEIGKNHLETELYI